MRNISKEIEKVRQKLKRGPADTLLLQKPFAKGMYYFMMFMIDYYSRVRTHLKIDYDSFMIIQTVTSHNLYNLNKKKKDNSYSELDSEWENIIYNVDKVTEIFENNSEVQNRNKLTISSICLVTNLPKETVRRKTGELIKKNLLRSSKKGGILLGHMYKEVFRKFVPQTTLEVSKLLKSWEQSGVLKSILSFKI